MKTITVIGKNIKENEIVFSQTHFKDGEVLITKIEIPNTTDASDGSHTFDELYEHRYRLFIALCKQLKENSVAKVWRSKEHAIDVEGKQQGMYEGYFIMGIGQTQGEMITYHLPLSLWEATNFAYTFDTAYEWDGHTSKDVLERIKRL